LISLFTGVVRTFERIRKAASRLSERLGELFFKCQIAMNCSAKIA